MKLDFGVFDHMDRAAFSIGEVYSNRLRLVEAYEESGFYAYHVAEHHATSLGMAPSPGIFLAAVAQRTRRLRFGPSVYVLPAHDPLRLIEEICMLDHLSGGRFELGVGRGFSPFELAYFGVGHLESRGYFDEALEVIKQGLTSDTLRFSGRYFNYSDVPMVLSPFQKPFPPLWQGVTSPNSARLAAGAGTNILMNGPAARVRPAADLYKAEWSKLSGQLPLPKLGLTRHIFVGESDAQAENVARSAYAAWYQANSELWRKFQTESFIFARTYDEAIGNKVAIVGAPETVRARLMEDMEGSGCNYFVGRFAFGDLTLANVLRSVELFCAEVMPAFG